MTVNLADRVEGRRPFQIVEATPHLVFYGGKICMQERDVQTGEVRYLDVTVHVAEALAPLLRAKEADRCQP
jgi:hypothetical protein